jgi:hypothetical protein
LCASFFWMSYQVPLCTTEALLLTPTYRRRMKVAWACESSRASLGQYQELAV